MKSISIVIPVYNEEKFIQKLLESVRKINYPGDHFEVIVVNDASTDHTTDVVKQFPEVKLVDLPENVGRYLARKTGAEAAGSDAILFVDSRSVVDPEILSILNSIDAKAVNGYSLGVETPGPFETFYRAVRRIVFARFYRRYNQPFYLTSENFDSMPKGTGVFYAEKAVLFDVYRELSHVDMGKEASDDTKLLRTIVNRTPILIHPGVKIINYARTSFSSSVSHLYHRGTKFVDYYFSPTKKYFWLVIVLPLIGLVGLLLGLVFMPYTIVQKLTLLAGLDVLITLLMSKSLREFSIILYMMPLCAAVFYAGIMRGILLQGYQRIRRRPENGLPNKGVKQV